MYTQAGIRDIELIEYKDIRIIWSDMIYLTTASEINFPGTSKRFENVYMPSLEITGDVNADGIEAKSFDLRFYLFGFPAFRDVRNLKESFRGWALKITLYDNTTWFLKCPLFCSETTTLKIQDAMAYELRLKTTVPTVADMIQIIESSIDVTYTFDQTSWSFDSEIVTFDND